MKSRICVKEMKMQEEVQLDWPWANDAFIVTVENNKHNWPAFHISAISATSGVFLFLFPSFFPQQVKSEALKDISVNLGFMCICFIFLAPAEIGFLPPAAGLRFVTIDSGS